MKVLGIIPARGGSKGVPLKNLKLLGGKPLVVHTIEAARASGVINRLVVSTDHAEISTVSKKAGAEVISRPAELATDVASTESALLQVLDVLKKEGFEPDVVLTLEPTSPFRSPALIMRCVELFKNAGIDSVIGVTETRSNYGKIVDGEFKYLFPGQPRRRQDREPLYMESSTIYGTRTATLRQKKLVLGDHLAALVVPEAEAIDINTALDFEFAEHLLASSQEQLGGKV